VYYCQSGLEAPDKNATLIKFVSLYIVITLFVIICWTILMFNDIPANPVKLKIGIVLSNFNKKSVYQGKIGIFVSAEHGIYFYYILTFYYYYSIYCIFLLVTNLSFRFSTDDNEFLIDICLFTAEQRFCGSSIQITRLLVSI